MKDLEKDEIPIPQILVENAPSQRHTMESLSFKSAVNYHRLGNKEKMMAALERLPKLEERTDFLIHRNYIKEAANLLEKYGIIMLRKFVSTVYTCSTNRLRLVTNLVLFRYFSFHLIIT